MDIQKVQSLRSDYRSKYAIKTDNFVFRLHYRYTVLLLIVLGVLATSFNVFHQPIECTSNQKNVNRVFINAFCYTNPTFTIDQPVLDKKNMSNTDVLQMPALTNSRQNGARKIYVHYYQWISLVLFSQALLLNVSRFLWRNHEKKIVKNLMLDVKVDWFDDEKTQRIISRTIEFLIKKPSICRNYWYYLHVLLEILNLVNVMLQFFLMNHFLNMSFIDYGWKVIMFDNWSYEHYFDPMTKMFPKVTKCLYSDVGSSGSRNQVDYLCVLPYNNMNEKIYLIIWIWFQILIIASFINLTYRILLSFSHALRLEMIFGKNENYHIKKAISSIISNITIGEWYILNVLSNNLDDRKFNEIVNGIYEILIQKREFANHL